MIGIVAPAGPLQQPEALERGAAALERLGFRVRFGNRIFESIRYLAGEDGARAEELMRAFEDPGLDAVLALRGGYGCSRLVPLLDERRLNGHCKIFMGFSDLTTLHLYFRRRLSWATLHGPMAASPALSSMTPEQEAHLVSLWTDPGYEPELVLPGLGCWERGVAEGELVGGCLSILAASLGTPYEIRTEGKILFLEDQGEAPYRIDRMLTHLALAGKLDRVAGILLGSFEGCDSEDAGDTVQAALRDRLCGRGVPVVAHFPAGHGAVNWAIPMGIRVRLDAERGSLRFLESWVI